MNEMAPCVCLRVRVRRRGPFPKSWPSPNSWQFRGCGYVAPVAAVAFFALLALLFWLCSSGFARSVAPVAAVALFLAGFALYEYSRTSWGWDQLAANLAPWRCVCCMRHLMTGVATAGVARWQQMKPTQHRYTRVHPGDGTHTNDTP